MTLSAWNKCLQSEPTQAEIPRLAPVEIRSHPWRGYFLITGATLCWGAAATFGKSIFNGKLFAGDPAISPLVLTQARTTFAAAILTIFLLLRNGTSGLRINRRDLFLCALTGTLGLAGSNFFYYWAIQRTTVAVAITVQYTSPVWVLLFMVTRGRQRLTMTRVLAVLLALMGIALITGLVPSGMKLSAAGVGAAILAAFSFSFYNITAQGLVARNHPLKIMAYALLSSAVLWLVLDPPWRLMARHYTGGQWAFLFLFSCLSMLLPYVFYFNGLKYLDPTRAVITSGLEPVFASLFAFVFVHEPLDGLQVLGMTAVLLASVMVQRQSQA